MRKFLFVLITSFFLGWMLVVGLGGSIGRAVGEVFGGDTDLFIPMRVALAKQVVTRTFVSTSGRKAWFVVDSEQISNKHAIHSSIRGKWT